MRVLARIRARRPSLPQRMATASRTASSPRRAMTTRVVEDRRRLMREGFRPTGRLCLWNHHADVPSGIPSSCWVPLGEVGLSVFGASTSSEPASAWCSSTSQSRRRLTRYLRSRSASTSRCPWWITVCRSKIAFTHVASTPRAIPRPATEMAAVRRRCHEGQVYPPIGAMMPCPI